MLKIPRIDHASKDHFYPAKKLKITERVRREMFQRRSAMTHHYVYRGVAYTKEDGKITPVKTDRFAKIYRGATYFKLPKVKHVVMDHIYRGYHYAA